MGLMMLGLCIYFWGLILLIGFFLFHIVKKIKKVGFQKTVKSKTIWAIFVLIAIGSGFLIDFLFLDATERSGNQLFQDYLLTPAPKSVEVLHSFDGGADFYPDYCLHFKISPDDFQLILTSKKWQTVSEAPYLGLECGPANTSWDFNFPPPALGGNVITYTFIPRERDIEIMFTNPQMNEVYYYYHDGNLP